MPGRFYFATYAHFHAALSTRVMYPRAERAALGEHRRKLLRKARGRTIELIGAGIGINVPGYPPEVDELVLALPQPHMARRLRRDVAASGRPAEIIEATDGPLPLPDDSFDTAVATLSLCMPDQVTPLLAEITRVLRPGGRLLFLEHVRSDRPGLARWQNRLAPAWRYVAIGCTCNRDTVTAIEESGLRIEQMDHGILPKLGPLVRPLVAGTAVLPEAS